MTPIPWEAIGVLVCLAAGVAGALAFWPLDPPPPGVRS